MREHRCIYVDRGSELSIQSESNINPLPSVAQMWGVNDDCYVYYYIQQLNTSMA